MDKQKKTKPKSKKSNSNESKPKGPRISYLVRPDFLSLEEWQIALRLQAAEKGKFVIERLKGDDKPGYYTVKSPIYSKLTASHTSGAKPQIIGYGSSHDVVYRGRGSKWNYCSCMDFRTSGLGTCKHIEAVKIWLREHKRVSTNTEPMGTSVYIDYTDGRKIKIRIGRDNETAITDIAKEYFTSDGTYRLDDPAKVTEFLAKAHDAALLVKCYQDVYEHIRETARKENLISLSEILDDSLIQSLIKSKLFAYQLEGIKFAFRHGRSIIADEMGLGKTIQAIGVAELMRHFHLTTSVLVVCPTSLKYQWKHEIEKFTGSTVTVVEGNAMKRKEIYENNESYYKIVSYNALANDIKLNGTAVTDLLIMDEVQRLKNWDTKIAKAARKIQSAYTILLSGTPLENKLEELYSIVELIDQYILSPYYLFRDKYIVTDSSGMTIGYKNLNDISLRLKDTLIRRRKKDVSMQMPARMDKTLYVPMTKEQTAIHEEYSYKLSILVKKWRTYHFLSEIDRQRILLLLAQMRMVANSTFILDQHSRHDTKVEEVKNILEDIIWSGDEKVVIFSGWERMTRLIAAELDKMGVKYSNLNGSVPSIKRKSLVEDFTNDPECRVFLSTDAGATGLNLQAGSIIINMELPWNPAVHEQRIGRIFRLGQTRNIQVINMVSQGSIEEEIQTKLQFKSAVAEGILDDGSDSVFLPEKKKFDELIETLDKMMEEKDKDPSEPQDVEAVEIDDEPEPLAETPETRAKAEPIDENDSMAEEAEEDKGYDESEEEDIEPTTESQSDTQQSQNDTSASTLVSQGVSFLSGLASALKSPERTRELVNEIVKTDQTTGQTTLQIPVPDKETVTNILTMIGNLFK